MNSIEKRLASAILGTMRARKQKTDGPQVPQGAPAEAPPKLREASVSDFDGVMALRRTAGWSADSMENWDRLWHRNPALGQMPTRPPIGWVLEARSRIVGYLGNIPLIYRYGDRTLTAVTGSGLVVDPAYRAATLSLNAAFYGQKSVDLFLTTTAIEAVGRIARAFKSAPLPQPEYDSMLFWVLEPAPFAKVMMRKLGLRPAVSTVGGVCASLAVRADRILRRRRPSWNRTDLEIRDIGVTEIGEDFDAFWNRKLKEQPRLLANRDSATLRWHFEIPGDRGSGRVLCHYKNGELLGYAIVRHEPANDETGLSRSIIADMMAMEDDGSILRSLWVAAYQHARQAGSHVFEVLGFPPSVRKISSPWHPYSRKYPACPFFYKAADAGLHRTFSDEKVWYASPFDGDTTLWGFGS